MTILALNLGKRRAYLVTDTVPEPVGGQHGHVQKAFPNAVLGLVVFGRGTCGALISFVTALGNLPLESFDDAAGAMSEVYGTALETLAGQQANLSDGMEPEIGMVGWSERQRRMRAVHCSRDDRGIELDLGLHLAPSDPRFPTDVREPAELLEVARQQVAWCDANPGGSREPRSGGKLVLTTIEAERLSQTVHGC